MANFGTIAGDYEQFNNSELPDKIVLDMLTRNQTLGVESEATILFGNEASDGKLQTLERQYYFTSSGLEESGVDQEAKTGSTDSALDTKTTELRFFSARYIFPRSIIEFGSDRHINEKAAEMEHDWANLYGKFNQALADVLLRGQESSYTDVYGKVITETDMEGSNPLFAPLHKIASGTVNDYRWNNLCVRYDDTAKTYVINPALSKDALISTYQYAKRIRDHNGDLGQNKNLSMLLCATNKHLQMYELLGSSHQINTANNNIEAFSLIMNQKINFFDWNRLYQDGEGNTTNPASGTNYDEFWFLFDPTLVKKELKYSIYKMPNIVKETEVGNSGAQVFTTSFEYKIWTEPKGAIFASNGKEAPAPTNFPIK